MKMIGGVSQRTSGSLSIMGLDPEQHGPEVRAHLGVVPQQDNLDEELKVRDNLLVYGRYFGLPMSYLQAQGRRAARVRPAHRQGQVQGRRPLRRHEAAPDDRPLAHQRAPHPAAGRADHRPRPAGAAHPLGPAVPAQGAGRHADPHHALHGRGRAAVRPADRGGQGQDHGRGISGQPDPRVLHPGGARAALRLGAQRERRRGARRHRRTRRDAAGPGAHLRPRRRGRPGAGHRPRPAAGHLAGPPLLARGRVPAPDRPEPR